jgi:hypothetical protein
LFTGWCADKTPGNFAGVFILSRLVQKCLMRYRKLHPVTADMRREISVAALAKAGAFKRPMRFPFQHLETAPDHIRVFRVGEKNRQSSQIVAIEWRKLRFGWRPFFICSRCNKRRVFLYHDGLFCYCRVCADLWYWCQRKHRRTRLLHRSHKLRVRLGDETGSPRDPIPARPHLQTHRRYHIIINKLRDIERRYLHVIASDGRRYRQRDERGRYLPRETSGTVDLGE